MIFKSLICYLTHHRDEWAYAPTTHVAKYICNRCWRMR